MMNSRICQLAMAKETWAALSSREAKSLLTSNSYLVHHLCSSCCSATFLCSSQLAAAALSRFTSGRVHRTTTFGPQAAYQILGQAADKPMPASESLCRL
eukprot:1461786-Pleurochrysis_carterae.AAC.4